SQRRRVKCGGEESERELVAAGERLAKRVLERREVRRERQRGAARGRRSIVEERDQTLLLRRGEDRFECLEEHRARGTACGFREELPETGNALLVLQRRQQEEHREDALVRSLADALENQVRDRTARERMQAPELETDGFDLAVEKVPQRRLVDRHLLKSRQD